MKSIRTKNTALYILLISLVLSFPPIAVADKTSDTPWLGIEIGAVPPSVREAYELPPRRGVFIYNIRVDSEAEGSDLRPGDVLIEKDEYPIRDPLELRSMLILTEPDSTVRFSLLRWSSGTAVSLRLSIARAPTAPPVETPYWPGFVPLRIPDALLAQINLDKSIGNLIIGSVHPFGPAAAAGLRNGDIISSIGGKKVTELPDLYEALNTGGELSELRIFRQGKFYRLTLSRRNPE